jgi:PAS domain S-box-containing protein
VFLCVDAAVGIVGDDGRILMTNPSMDRLLGYKPNALVGHNWLDFIAPSSRAKVSVVRQRQIEDSKDSTVEATLLTSNGTEVSAKLSSTLLERHDLKRFRVVTILPLAAQSASVEPPVIRPRPTAASAQPKVASAELPATSPKPLRVQVVGKIRLIGLEEVKSALGDRWPAAAERAMAAAEHIIKQRCGPRDNYGRTEDSGFVICFADATEEEAAFHAAMIARDIKNKLIGQGETASAAHVSAITDSVQLPDEPNQSISQLAGMIEQRMTARLAAIESAARENLKAAVEQAACEMEAIHGRERNEILAHYARLPALLERRMYSALAALPVAECKDFDIDTLMLGLATEEASRGLLNGSNQPVLVTVSFDIFNTRGRTDHYIAGCQKLDPRLRRRLILILTDLPDGIPRSRVLQCVTRLRPFCRGVGFAVSELEAPPVDLSNAGVPIVTLMAENLRGTDGNAKAKLAKLIGTLHANRARLLVRHCASWESASNLLSAGADLVSLAA